MHGRGRGTSTQVPFWVVSKLSSSLMILISNVTVARWSVLQFHIGNPTFLHNWSIKHGKGYVVEVLNALSCISTNIICAKWIPTCYRCYQHDFPFPRVYVVRLRVDIVLRTNKLKKLATIVSVAFLNKSCGSMNHATLSPSTEIYCSSPILTASRLSALHWKSLPGIMSHM